jgi:hypothetical protein
MISHPVNPVKKIFYFLARQIWTLKKILKQVIVGRGIPQKL